MEEPLDLETVLLEADLGLLTPKVVANQSEEETVACTARFVPKFADLWLEALVAAVASDETVKNSDKYCENPERVHVAVAAATGAASLPALVAAGQVLVGAVKGRPNARMIEVGRIVLDAHRAALDLGSNGHLAEMAS